MDLKYNLKNFLLLFLALNLIIPGFRPVKALDPVTTFGLIVGIGEATFFLINGYQIHKAEKEKALLEKKFGELNGKLDNLKHNVSQKNKSKYNKVLCGMGVCSVGTIAVIISLLKKNDVQACQAYKDKLAVGMSAYQKGIDYGIASQNSLNDFEIKK